MCSHGDRLGGTRHELAERASQKVRAFRQAKEQVTGVERLAQASRYRYVLRDLRITHTIATQVRAGEPQRTLETLPEGYHCKSQSPVHVDAE